MRTQNTRRFADAVSIQRSTIHYNQPTMAFQPLGKFWQSWLVRALWLCLLAAAIAAAARAQDIYVNSLNQGAIVGKYGPDGTVINANFVRASEADFVGLSVSGTTLVVADQEEFPYNDGVGEMNTTTGVPLPLVIPLPRRFPESALIGGPHIFVLVDPGSVGEYLASDGSQVNSDISAGAASGGRQMAGWTDALGNVNLYITTSGSVLHITVGSSGTIITSTLITGLTSPTGIAVSPDGQYVYVLSSGAISKYAASNGAPQWTSATISGTPWSLAASAGAVYVTRHSANAVGAYYAGTGAKISDTLITGLYGPTGIAVGPPACVHPPANMAAWYTFDQTGSAQEDLAMGNHATAYNTTSIGGEVATALQFNGSTAYAEAPSQTSNNLGREDFSMDAWVKIANPTDASGVRVLVDKRDASRGYHLFLYNGRIGVQLMDSSGFDNYISTAAVPADNRWHLVAVTVIRNLPTGGAWYLDGAPIGTFDPRAHPNSLDSTSPLDIGVRSAGQGGGSYFKGGIDEVEIFTRALGSGEVFSLMQAGPSGKCKCLTPPSSMVAWYAFDQTGSTQNDLALGNTATAYSTTSITGEVANALQFNGTNSHVEAPSTSYNNLGTSDLTFSVWLKVASASDYNSSVVSLLDKRDGYPLRGYQFFLYYGRIGLQLADGSGSGYGNYLSTTLFPTNNQWHLVTVTVQRTLTNGGRWYLDGVQIDTPFNPSGHAASINSSAPLSIGVQSGGVYDFFKGGMDEVQIFNRALSTLEVQSMLKAGHAGACKN